MAPSSVASLERAALRHERALAQWLRRMAHLGRAQALESAAAAHGATRRAHEAADRRRDRGTWYTPPALVEAVLNAAMPAQCARSGAICDPACGSGNFLVAAARRMRAAGRDANAIAQALGGRDLDPRAVALARVRLRTEFGGAPSLWRRSVRCGDSLAAGAWDHGSRRVRGGSGRARFTAVVGNPPFLSPVRQRTAGSRSEARALAERFNGAVRGYADTACAFLLLAAEVCAPRGRIGLVLPMSMLSTAHAGGVRAAVSARCALRACLVPPARCFGGGVPTVVPILEVAPRGPRRIRVTRVLESRAPAPIWLPARMAAKGAWGALGAALAGVPAAREPRPQVPLRDIAEGTADFRQHFYGLKGCVHETAVRQGVRGEEGNSPRVSASTRQGGRSIALPAAARRAAVVTVGSVDAARCLWGLRPVRLHGRTYTAPMADLGALRRVRGLATWPAERLVPKAIVATQTRAIEAWADEHGRALPCTPLVSIMPRRRTDLWRVVAVLLAPATAAIAWWRYAGAARTATALKLSARQILALPLPTDAAAWARGAALVRAWHARPNDAERRMAFADAMCAAYGIRSGTEREALVCWWSALVSSDGSDPPAGARSPLLDP